MKNLVLSSLIIVLFAACNNPSGNTETTAVENGSVGNNGVDLIEKYGADDYGMKHYVLAFLKRGPNRDQDSATAASIQRAHLDNIGRMAEKGQLVLAGPFLDDTEIRGIYIFNVESVLEAEKLTATDPAIQSGRLTMELHPWYGSAALMEVNTIHKKISKKNI